MSRGAERSCAAKNFSVSPATFSSRRGRHVKLVLLRFPAEILLIFTKCRGGGGTFMRGAELSVTPATFFSRRGLHVKLFLLRFPAEILPISTKRTGGGGTFMRGAELFRVAGNFLLAPRNSVLAPAAAPWHICGFPAEILPILNKSRGGGGGTFLRGGELFRVAGNFFLAPRTSRKPWSFLRFRLKYCLF